MAGKNELLIKINGNAKSLIEELDKVKKQSAELKKVLGTVAKASAIAFTGLTTIIAGVTKVYADYETALVGVGKTTNLTGKDLKKLGNEISALSSTIPISTNELLGMAQAGGQLGVSAEHLVKFTDTVARLGVATDLTGEQAAIGLTRILTVTGEGIENIDKFGSVIVQLGNNFAATESEIVHMTGEVAKSTAIFGVNSTQAAGMATALKAIGVRAQLGGSAVGRAFRAIDKAVREGGKQLKDLETLTGRTGDELTRVFQEDATAAFQIFVESLGDVEKSGGDVTAALAQFGLKGEEILKVLPVLAKNSDFFGRAINTATKELEDNTALMNESEAAFDTLNSKTTLLRNDITKFAREIGEKLAPEITNLVANVRGLVSSLLNMDDSTKQLIATVLKWGAILAGAIAAVSAFALAWVTAIPIMAAVGAGMGAIATAVGIMGGPITLAIVAVAALTAGLALLFEGSAGENETQKDLEQIVDELEAARKKQKELNDLLKDKSAIEINHSAFLGAKNRELKKLDDLIAKNEELAKTAKATNKEFGLGFGVLARPEDAAPVDLSVPGLEDLPLGEVQAPFAINQEEREQDVQAEVSRAESAAKKAKKIDEAKNKDKLDAQRELNAQLAAERAIFDAEDIDGASKKELELLAQAAEFDTQLRDISRQREAAELIKNEEIKAATLQNIEEKNQLLLDQQEAFNEKSAEQRAEDRERQVILDEELRAIDVERTAALNDEDLQALQQKVLTEDEVERKIALEKATREVKARNQEVEDTKKFGTVIASLNRFFSSEEVGQAKSTANTLSELSQSENKKLAGIGRAAARVRAAIHTAEGAIGAYTSLASIPFVGPVLGAAAAAAVIAFGVEQQQKISSAQRGGIVQNAQGGARDRVPALLEPGELVVPRALTPDFIQSVGRPDGSAEGGAGSFSVEIGLRDDLIEFVEDGLQERQSLNITNEGIS